MLVYRQNKISICFLIRLSEFMNKNMNVHSPQAIQVIIVVHNHYI